MDSAFKLMVEFLEKRGFESISKDRWNNEDVDITILSSDTISLAVILSPLRGCMYEEYCYIIDSRLDEAAFIQFKCRVTGLLNQKPDLNFIKNLFTLS